MERLIIENRIDMTMFTCLEYIAAVVKEGKISESEIGKTYCFVTKFKNNVMVGSTKNKNSDKLTIFIKKNVDK